MGNSFHFHHCRAARGEEAAPLTTPTRPAAWSGRGCHTKYPHHRPCPGQKAMEFTIILGMFRYSWGYSGRYLYIYIQYYIYICIHGYIMIHIHILYMVNNMINAVNLQNRKPSKNTRWEWRFIGFTSSPCGVLAIENHHILLMNFHMFTYYSQPKLRIFQLTLNKLSKPNTKPSPKSSFYGWYKPSKYGWCIVALLTFIQILLINPIMNHPQNHHGWIVSTIPK